MDVQGYVDTVRHQLNVAAAAGGEHAAALADRLSAPLESAIRLVVLEALSAAAEEITRELAPGSVDVRLRGRDPEFVVVAPPGEETAEPAAAPESAELPVDDDGGTWRVTLRLPESLRPKVETAARREGTSVNTWLVRAAAARVEPPPHRADARRHVTGWVR
jgi:hypothetical protein